MRIEELKEGDAESNGQQKHSGFSGGATVVFDAKVMLVGVGARALFYPTLLYNVVRYVMEPEFHWWDRVDEHLLLGAVPFPNDVPRLKALGVCGVVTLNEPYEALVPTSLYHHHGIDHLVIPTRDYLFAPLLQAIHQAVEFIHRNSLSGGTTYVHCKAGRGRSTTVVLCYLHKQMTPENAYEYVRSIRPRVLLAPTQWKAVQDYYTRLNSSKSASTIDSSSSSKALTFPEKAISNDLDYSSLVLVTESDLVGYEEEIRGSIVRFIEANLACRVHFTRQAAMSKLSFLWPLQKSPRQPTPIPVTINMGVDIHVC